ARRELLGRVDDPRIAEQTTRTIRSEGEGFDDRLRDGATEGVEARLKPGQRAVEVALCIGHLPEHEIQLACCRRDVRVGDIGGAASLFERPLRAIYCALRVLDALDGLAHRVLGRTHALRSLDTSGLPGGVFLNC